MIDPYLAQFISADKPAVTFDTRETVQLQDALNKIGDEEGIELWRKRTQRERQQFFFLAGRVEDLETWMRIAKKTWIAAMREEFHRVQTERQQHRFFCPLIDVPLVAIFFGDAKFAAVEIRQRLLDGVAHFALGVRV